MKAILMSLSLLILLMTVSESTLAQDPRLVTKEKLIQELSVPSTDIRLRGVSIVPKKKSPEATVYIFFKFGSTELADKFSRKQLKEAGEALSSDVLLKYRFEVAGHTDNIGTDNYNQELSERRAMVIKQFLNKTYEIPESRLEVKGYGESVPIARNDTDEGRAKNRRVVFKRID